MPEMHRRALLGWISVSLAVPSRASSLFDDSRIAADALAAAEWVAKALTQSGYRADFSMRSLAEIDRFFDEQSAGGAPVKGGLLSEDLGSRLFAIGSYVGETIRRNLGGDWIGDDADPQAEISIALKLDDETVVWPVQRVMKRLRNGAEDGIAAYGEALSSSR